jgi:hypothetical protein
MAFSAEDIVPDSPTNNFCTLNVLLPTTTVNVSNGNLSGVVGNAATKIFSTFLLPNIGQWYWEVVFSTFTAEGSVGIAEVDSDLSTHVGYDVNSFGFRTGNKATNSVNTPYGATYGTGDVVRVLWDGNNRQILFGVNETMYGVAFTVSTDKDYYPAFGDNAAGASSTFSVNFGQDPTFGGTKTSGSADAPDANGIGSFYYQPPTGALALCTANLPDFTPTVTDDTPQDYFKAVTYQASGVNNQIQNVNVGFQPDLIWIKNRDNTETHYLTDTIRSSLTNDRLDKFLCSNETSAEATVSNRVSDATITLKSYGFDISDSDMANGELYFGTRKYVAWCWKAGGAPSADDKAMVDGVESTIPGDAKLDAGNITPTRMSVNTKAGFSVVKFSAGSAGNKTIPHGLDYKPDFVLLKGLDSASGWFVYHNGLSDDTKYLYLHDSFSESDLTQNSRTWGGRTFDNNVISAESNYTMLANENYIAYCWHSVENYSKFGSYTGNGSADGPFVFCGFRPAFVMVKNTSSTGSWIIHDSSRNDYNPSSNHLRANNSNSEDPGTAEYIDILSNGWKSRGAGGNVNLNSSTTYIYMAFAEQPFKYSNAR